MNLQEQALAKKYAQAFFRVFGDRLTPEIIANILQFAAWCEQHRQQFFYTNLSSIPIKTKYELLMQHVERFGLKDLLKSLVMLLAEQGRLLLLAVVLRQLIVVYQEQQGIVEIRCKSVRELTLDEKQTIEQRVGLMTGKRSQITYYVEPKLIAGIRLESETFLWEHSVAQHLRLISLSV